MQNEKEPKKLTAEELEKRVAPAALTVDTGGDTAGSGPGQKAPGKDGGVKP